MAEISKINVNGTAYDVVDEVARKNISDLSEEVDSLKVSANRENAGFSYSTGAIETINFTTQYGNAVSEYGYTISGASLKITAAECPSEMYRRPFCAMPPAR